MIDAINLTKELIRRPSVTPADADYLRQLFHVADLQPEFDFYPVFAETLIAELARLKRLPNARLAKLQRKSQLRAPIYWPSVALAQMYAMLWAEVADAG